MGAGLLLVVALISIRLGTHGISTGDVWNGLFHYDPTSYNQTLVRTMRLPRTVIAVGIGCSMAVAGAVMQGVTRNPLADPSIIGVSSGSSFAIVVVVYYGHRTNAAEYLPFAFLGGVLAAFTVMAIGAAGKGGMSPVRLALAGIVISALLSSWTSALLLLDQSTYELVRYWFAGSVAYRDINLFWQLSPILLVPAVLCLAMGHHLNILGMGEEMAQSLGMRTGRLRLFATSLVVLMTAAAVAIAGPISYIGLAIPHMVRSVVGPDYRWVLPYSAIYGAIFLLLSDILGRIVMRPGEIEVGIVTALFGAPFLIYLARKRSLAG
ncbi:MAG: iron ABC transporter permease [Thermomicrobiales bacterium]|jgi:iron complex transport system permease protein|nr:iron ABC transporter permease [Thermomicrobiales bacterium]